jgi:hypothetical protein
MSTLPSVVLAEVVNELPVPAVVYGLGVFAGLAVLAMITYSYRNVANKRRGPQGGHQAGH